METIFTLTENTPLETLDEAFNSNKPGVVVVEEFPNKDFVVEAAKRLNSYKPDHVIVDLKKIKNEPALIEAITGLLLPVTELVVPSIPEAEVLDRMSVDSEPDMEMAAKQIYDRTGASVLILSKGIFAAKNLLYTHGTPIWFDKVVKVEDFANGLASGKELVEIIK